MNRGRPREFDEKVALKKAMLVFWRNGYRGTSLDDLTEALQIKRPSLYAAFKDKETLFLRVVDFYVEQTVGPAMIAFSHCDNLRDGLNQFFQAYASIVVGEDTPPGCFVNCLLGEECCQSEVIRQKLSDLIQAGDRICSKPFNRLREQLKPSVSPEAAASLLVCTVEGLALRARAGASRDSLLAVGALYVDMVTAG
jgi:AcrR family transcriptional regulator